MYFSNMSLVRNYGQLNLLNLKAIAFMFSLMAILVLSNSCTNNGSNESDLESYLVVASEELPFRGDYDGIESIFEFDLFKISYRLEVLFEPDILKEYRNIDHFENGIQLANGEEVNQVLYSKFLSQEDDLYLLEGVLASLRERSIGTEIDMVQLIVAFVQSIPYEIAGPQKYPFETLYLNKGDCSDKSVLLCKLLMLEGYETCLFSYEEAEHMAVGIRIGQNEDDYYDGYAYIEATAYSPIGEIPKELAGGIVIDEDPEIISSENNGDLIYDEMPFVRSIYGQLTESYGDGYISTTKKGRIVMEDMQQLTNQLDSMKRLQLIHGKTIESLDLELEQMGCGGEVDESIYSACVSLNETRNIEVEEFNSINNIIDQNIELYNTKTTQLNIINKAKNVTAEEEVAFR